MLCVNYASRRITERRKTKTHIHLPFSQTNWQKTVWESLRVTRAFTFPDLHRTLFQSPVKGQRKYVKDYVHLSLMSFWYLFIYFMALNSPWMKFFLTRSGTLYKQIELNQRKHGYVCQCTLYGLIFNFNWRLWVLMKGWGYSLRYFT